VKKRFLGQPLRRILTVVGACAVVIGGASLAATGYDLLTTASGQDAPPEAPASTHRVIRPFPDEVGGIYDRPLLFPTPVPTPNISPEPVVVAQPQAAPVAPPPAPRSMPYRLVIDRIGVNAPVGVYGLDSKQVPQVPYNGSEVAWYKFTSEPGTGGNAVFAGHVTWNGRAVFYRLDDLHAGDRINVLRQDGSRLAYTVQDVFLVDATDPASVSVMSSTPTDTLTVITCGGSPYYVGGVLRYDYTHRLIVRAAFTSFEPGG
jgi:LPXTG-site transpeptidase (sortase) family protein